MSEARVSEIASQILSSESFTDAVESKTLTSESVTSIVEGKLSSVNTQLDKTNESFKKIEATFGNIGSALMKVKLQNKKIDINGTISTLQNYSSKLNIVN